VPTSRYTKGMAEGRIRIRRSALPGIDCTEAASALTFARHSHDAFGIGIISAGAQRSASGRGPVEAGAGDVITVNPGEVHDGAPIGGARTWRMLYLAPAEVHRAAEELGLAAPRITELRRPVIRDPALGRRVEEAFALITAAEAEPLACEAALVRLLDGLLLRHASACPRPVAAAPIARARQRIDDDPAADVSLAALARDAGMSRFQLLRGFARETGLPPHAYRRVRRVMRAKALIRAGAGLADVAAAVGFADQSHMNRAFVATTGATPGAWASALR
jgi:AraC-like DNA-binding protein